MERRVALGIPRDMAMMRASSFSMGALVKEIEKSFELIVRPDVSTRVNNGCITFVQSPLGLVELRRQD